MSTTNTTNTNKTQSENTGAGFNWQNGFTDSVRDLVGLQFRTAQFVMDKTLGFGQAMSDFYQNQMNETVKLTQEYSKYGWTLTENLKKSATEFTDRTVKGFQG